MPSIEQTELEQYHGAIVGDVEKLVEKYRAIFDWNVPDINQKLADRLILGEVRKGARCDRKEIAGIEDRRPVFPWMCPPRMPPPQSGGD